MEMERLWLAVFPSMIVAFFIHRAIVNNISGMRRVFGGNLMGNWGEFCGNLGVVGDSSKSHDKTTPGKTDG